MSPIGKPRHHSTKSPLFGIIPLVVLKILSTKPMHGYQLAEELAELLGETVPKPLVYVTLKRLEERNLLTSEWQLGESGPPKRVYHITEKGSKFLEHKLERIKKLNKILEFLLQ